MSNTVYLRFTSDTPDTVKWLLNHVDGQPAESVQTGTLEQFAKQVSGQRIVLIVPSKDLLFTHAKLPTKNRQNLMKAVPYAIEDQLIDDVETLHFALGKTDTGGEISIAVVNKNILNDWIAQLKQFDLRAHWVCADIQCVPWQKDQWSVMLDDDIALVRLSQESGFVVEPDNLLPLLSGLVDRDPDDETLMPLSIWRHQGSPPRDFDSEAFEQAGIELQQHEMDQDPIQRFAASGDYTTVINLLQGEYSVREQLGKIWRPWYPAAALFLAWLSIQGIGAILDYRTNTQKSALLTQQIEQIYRKTFPQEKRVPDAKKLMQVHLNKLRKGTGASGAGFLTMVSQVGNLFKQDVILEVSQVSFRNGQLDVELIIKDLQSLDKLQQQIEQQGLKAEIRSANADAKHVNSRLRISGAVS